MPLHWKTKTIRVDKETGEVISEAEAQRNYTYINQIKKTYLNATRTIGYREFHKFYRRKAEQGKLFND